MGKIAKEVLEWNLKRKQPPVKRQQNPQGQNPQEQPPSPSKKVGQDSKPTSNLN